jgi:hypothetical protein
VVEYAPSRCLCSERVFSTNQFALSSRRLLNRHMHVQLDKDFTCRQKSSNHGGLD